MSHELIPSRLTASKFLWHLPAFLVLGIYLPAAVFGVAVFRDAYAVTLMGLLAVFTLIYYTLYARFAGFLRRPSLRAFLWRIGKKIDWPGWAWVAVFVYVATIAIAALTVPVTPLGAALRGDHWLDIAIARAELFANREGPEAALRYLSFILGRSVLPFLIAYLYWSRHRFRHAALAAVVLCYFVALEKAAPIFAFLPLIMLRLLEWRAGAALAHGVCMIGCVGLSTVLAIGALSSPWGDDFEASGRQEIHRKYAQSPKLEGQPEPPAGATRQYLHTHMRGLDSLVGSNQTVYQIYLLINRAIWVPYATAYDWLKFHDDVLGGRLVLGQSIGIVSRLLGKPRVWLDQMVYQYQFGASPAGGGSSNAVFLVDAKVNFGWPGVIIYCVFFTLFSAIVFSSENIVAQAASVTSFFTAALSSLTATLLSGGLLFFLAVSLLTRLPPRAMPSAENVQP